MVKRRPSSTDYWDEDEQAEVNSTTLSALAQHSSNAQQAARESEAAASRKRAQTGRPFVPENYQREPAHLDGEDLNNGGLPVRLLRDFVFYDRRQGCMVDFTKVREPDEDELSIEVAGDIAISHPLDLAENDEWDDEELPTAPRAWTYVKLKGFRGIGVDFAGANTEWTHSRECV